MRLISAAVRSSASSQLMRTHSSQPRSERSPPPGSQCLRLRGYFRRSAPNTSLRMERPRKHPRCCGASKVSGPDTSVRSHMTTPSSTYTWFTQLPPQSNQHEAFFHVPSIS